MIELQCNSRGNPVGISNGFAKFSDEQVAKIRQLREQGLSYVAIADKVGCSNTYAWKVMRGQLRSAEPERTVRSLEESDFPMVRSLYAQGLGAERISRHLGVSFKLVLAMTRRARELDGAPEFQAPRTQKLTPAQRTALWLMHVEDGLGYGRLAKIFGCSKSWARKLCIDEKVASGTTH
jgi:hypothetical protein